MRVRGQTDKLSKEFGIVIRRRRHKAGISQEIFAEKADIHRTYVSQIELGKVEIGLGVAKKIATALGVPLGSLIREAER